MAPRVTRKSRGTSTHRGRTAHSRQQRRKADLGQLAGLYQDLNAFSVDAGKVAVPGKYETTYGEVTPEGIQAMSALFSRYSPIQTMPAGQRSFYDLGCGNGKVVIGMAMLHPEIQARGYEIVVDRAEQAKTALSRLKQARVAARCRFETTSFLLPEVGLADACWIYVSNLCMNDETQGELAAKLEKECRAGCVVVCSKDIPFGDESPLVKVKSGENIPMSWSATSSVSVYRYGGER
jgi:hypothetical protein